MSADRHKENGHRITQAEARKFTRWWRSKFPKVPRKLRTHFKGAPNAAKGAQKSKGGRLL